nr:MAG TPA: hypothetical protein [Caudoviricetes sp.]
MLKFANIRIFCYHFLVSVRKYVYLCIVIKKQSIKLLNYKIMSTTLKNTMREVMNLAWQFVRKNGYTLSEALKCAWANIKLKAALSKRVVKFYFQKVDGSMREAYGTLMSERIPATKGTKKTADTCQVYFDTEKDEWRCFKKANLVRIA